MRYGAISRTVLEHLAESGKLVIGAFFSPQNSGQKSTRTVLSVYNTYYSSRSHQAAKQALSATLRRLKKQGLVAGNGPKKKMTWAVTKEGRKFLQQPRLRAIKSLYELPPEDGFIRLVTFDIPEKEQRKRRWLRAELLFCGFSPLHRSVYIGKRPLPSEFIKNIGDLGLNKYVHIIGIEKTGTLIKNR